MILLLTSNVDDPFGHPLGAMTRSAVAPCYRL